MCVCVYGVLALQNDNSRVFPFCHLLVIIASFIFCHFPIYEVPVAVGSVKIITQFPILQYNCRVVVSGFTLEYDR